MNEDVKMIRYFPVMIAVAVGVLSAQTSNDTWLLWDQLIQADLEDQPRMKGSLRNPNNAPTRVSTPPATSKTGRALPSDLALVGVTVWKLRAATAADPVEPRTKEIVHGPGRKEQPHEVIPSRIDLESHIGKEDRLILGVSSSRSGYLYVWSREKHANGAYSPAKLIFPTGRLHAGDNHIYAGQPVRLPGAEDDPPYYNLVRSTNQVAEEIVVVVAPKPIPGMGEGVVVQMETIRKWQKEWGSVEDHVNTRGTEPMNGRELAALSGGVQLGVRPQRIYRLRRPLDTNMLVSVPLSLKAD